MLARHQPHQQGIPDFESDTEQRLDRAILRTLAYSDLFDHPLSVTEIHRFLDAVRAPQTAVAVAVARLVEHARVSDHGGRFGLADRRDVGAIQRRRARLAAARWPRARRYATAISRVPFVKMVAVTGALALGQAADSDDIDLLIVCRHGRVWIARLFVVQLVRLARLRGVKLCPNYLVSELALQLAADSHLGSLYEARELAQMVPVAGGTTYARLRDENSWLEAWLPNAAGPPPGYDANIPDAGGSALLERLLGGGLGDRLESIIRRRKILEISSSTGPAAEVELGPEVCKGHQHGHRRTIEEAYCRRLAALFPIDEFPTDGPSRESAAV